MKLYSGLVVLCLSMTACTHDSGGKDSPKPTLQDRSAENRPSECPQGAEGRYTNDSEPTEKPAEITRVGGTYYFVEDSGKTVAVDGKVSTVDDGSHVSIICGANRFYAQTVTPEGISVDSVFTITGNSLKVFVKNKSTGETSTLTYTKI